MHPHVSLILVAAVYLLPNFESSGQTHPRLEIRRNDGATLLDYFPQSSEGGTAMLHFSDELEGLTATVAGLFQIPQGNAGLNWDVTSMATGARGFFHVTEHPGLSIADFVSEDLEPDPPTPPIFSLEALLSPPLHLAPGLSYHLRFRVIDGATGLPVTADGAARIHLLTAGGLIPAGSYTIIPDTLPMSEGVVDGTVRIETAASLAGLHLAVAEIMVSSAASRGPRVPISPTTDSIIPQLPKKLEDYQDSSGTWVYPLPTLVSRGGSFGEWRGSRHNTAGRPHEGMDFSASQGVAVYAVKRGVVAHVSTREKSGSVNLGYTVTLIHGDGTASVYRHMIPDVTEHQVVETRQMIGIVDDTYEPNKPTESPPKFPGDHLHLELRNCGIPGVEAGAYMTLVNNIGLPIGLPFDPGGQNDYFIDIRPIQDPGTDVNSPEIPALYLWDKDPRDKYNEFLPLTPSAPLQTREGAPAQYLIAQIIDKEGGWLVPSYFDFSSQSAASRDLELTYKFDYVEDGANMRKLFQGPSAFADFGYVKKPGLAIGGFEPLPRPAKYQYWFDMKLERYAGTFLGRRSFRVGARDLTYKQAEHILNFGPLIENPGQWRPTLANPQGSVFPLEVTSFFGPFPSAQVQSPTSWPIDELTLTFDPPAGTASWKAIFLDEGGQLIQPAKFSTSGKYQKITGESLLPCAVRVTQRENANPAPAETLKIKAVSKAFPQLAHEIQVQILRPMTEMVVLPGGSFEMGNHQYSAEEGPSSEVPVHTVTLKPYRIGRFEVTKAIWDDVKAWGSAHGYTDLPAGGGKGPDHPVVSVDWYSMIKWCNARSEKENLPACYRVSGSVFRNGFSLQIECDWNAVGYRLPTEAEWEMAARGGAAGRRFPWGETIAHTQANYNSTRRDHDSDPATPPVPSFSFDVSQSSGLHPDFSLGDFPHTSPVGAFPPNELGLFDTAGGVFEWCWDRHSNTYYGSSPSADPRGPISGDARVGRGGSWGYSARDCGVASRGAFVPTSPEAGRGFRLATSINE